jgi:hypothetical protein
MTNAKETFAPFLVGTSPAGVEYVARKPEDVEKLTRSLARQWSKHYARPVRGNREELVRRVRGQRCAKADYLAKTLNNWMGPKRTRVRLTAGAVAAILRRDDEHQPAGRIGATFVEGSRAFLAWCFDALTMRVEELEWAGADEMAEADTISDVDRTNFFEAANARRVKALRRSLVRLERAL